MHALVLFLDGVGLGDADPAANPFAAAHTPTLDALAGGQRWLRDAQRHDNGRALFIPTDPRLGVPGRPQSATGQATILTGRNVPAALGEHYGPRPNAAIRALLDADNLFKRVRAAGGSAALLTAFPPRFFAALARGKRLPSAIQHAALSAGVRLPTEDDIYAGTALSPDWTGEGWRSDLGYTDTPLYTPQQAGALLAALALQHTLTFFEHWVSDVIGHKGPQRSRQPGRPQHTQAHHQRRAHGDHRRSPSHRCRRPARPDGHYPWPDAPADRLRPFCLIAPAPFGGILKTAVDSTNQDAALVEGKP
jgi:hypothetical protein